MMIRQVTLIICAIIATTEAIAMQYPQGKQAHFKNSGIVIAGELHNQGKFTNKRGGTVIVHNGPIYNGFHQPHQAHPYYAQQSPYAQPTRPYPFQPVPTPHYTQPIRPIRHQMPTYNPRSHLTVMAENRLLTTEEEASIEEIERFSQFSDLLSKNLKRAVDSTNQLITGAEKALVTKNLKSSLDKDETAQDIKKVLMPIFGDEQNNTKTVSPEKKTTSIKLLQLKEKDASLFFFNPNPTLPQIVEKSSEKRPLFFTKESSYVPIGITPSVCDQLSLTKVDETKKTWGMVISTRHTA